MSFQEIRKIAQKADETEGSEREKLVKKLVEQLENYSIIEDVGWIRIQNARKVAELLKTHRIE